MTISLPPKFERFVQAKVSAGEFSSPAQVVEAALSRMMLEPLSDRLELDELPKLRESIDQMDRGEVRDWREFSAELRTKYLGE
jgi:Arc/MetJ-type ribon-helix-helix transcriptional regulator